MNDNHHPAMNAPIQHNSDGSDSEQGELVITACGMLCIAVVFVVLCMVAGFYAATVWGL
jgi:hypothetical protein